MEPAALERFPSPGKGSGLRTRRRLRPGELLYRAQPFAYIVSKEQLGGVCECCLRRLGSEVNIERRNIIQRNAHLQRCSQCKVAKYCGKSCQLRQSVCLSERLYSFSDLQSNIEQLSEEMKDGLRHLAQTLQLYLKTEIQDVSRLPPAIDFFQIFTKTISIVPVILHESEISISLNERFRKYCCMH
ncbi:histone-lysine n-methyltransferase smyd3 [Limosa lapponica baueri]|uniref:Histone-lysine n-methyltransferase smyd3 n=1 Tax=Limosa lapponica baueri TaxID=1758121 RepID=A0A2I0UPT7_LIMLA|nr:histone-lysine n-methyltransferase smyd3 [Limosa lapponica baueri]